MKRSKVHLYDLQQGPDVPGAWGMSLEFITRGSWAFQPSSLKGSECDRCSSPVWIKGQGARERLFLWVPNSLCWAVIGISWHWVSDSNELFRTAQWPVYCSFLAYLYSCCKSRNYHPCWQMATENCWTWSRLTALGPVYKGLLWIVARELKPWLNFCTSVND